MSQVVIKSSGELHTVEVKRRGVTYTYWRFFYTLRDGQRKPKIVGNAAKVNSVQASAAKQAFLNRAVNAPVASTGRIMSLREWLWHFKENVITDRATTTQKIYSTTSRYLLASMNGSLKLTAIQKRHAEKFKTDLIKNRLGKANKSSSKQDIASMATVARHVTTATAIFNAAVDAREMDFNPFKGVDVLVPVAAETESYVSREAMYQLLAACKGVHWEALLALCRWGGLRQQEARWQKWAHVDLEKRTMRVYGKKISRTKKTAEDVTRDVPINADLYAVLLRASAARQSEFVCGGRIAKGSQAGRTLRQLMARLGVHWDDPFHDMHRQTTTKNNPASGGDSWGIGAMRPLFPDVLHNRGGEFARFFTQKFHTAAAFLNASLFVLT
jgi:integrase